MAPVGAYLVHFATRVFPNQAPGATDPIAHAFARLEDAAWTLSEDHARCPLMDQFLPSGDMKALAKEYSYSGAIRRWNPFMARFTTYDPGNFIYGCAGWWLTGFVPAHSELRRELTWLNDEHIGDIFEATLGYIWMLEDQGVALSDDMLLLRDGIEKLVKLMQECLACLPMFNGSIYVSKDILKFAP